MGLIAAPFFILMSMATAKLHVRQRDNSAIATSFVHATMP